MGFQRFACFHGLHLVAWGCTPGRNGNCKSLLCSMFNEQTCSWFTWLFGRHYAKNIFENLIVLYFWKAQGPRTSKLIFPTVKHTNTQIQLMTKCQKYPTYAIFHYSWWFEDVKNYIPKCPKWSDPIRHLIWSVIQSNIWSDIQSEIWNSACWLQTFALSPQVYFYYLP